MYLQLSLQLLDGLCLISCLLLFGLNATLKVTDLSFDQLALTCLLVLSLSFLIQALLHSIQLTLEIFPDGVLFGVSYIRVQVDYLCPSISSSFSASRRSVSCLSWVSSSCIRSTRASSLSNWFSASYNNTRILTCKMSCAPHTSRAALSSSFSISSFFFDFSKS